MPLTIIGDQSIVGYLSDETTGERIRSLIDNYERNGCEDPVDVIINEAKPSEPVTKKSVLPEKLELPILGEIKSKIFLYRFLRSLPPPLTALIPALCGCYYF